MVIYDFSDPFWIKVYVIYVIGPLLGGLLAGLYSRYVNEHMI